MPTSRVAAFSGARRRRARFCFRFPLAPAGAPFRPPSPALRCFAAARSAAMPGARGPQRGVASAEFAGRAYLRHRLPASVLVDFAASPRSLLISSASCVCRCGFAMCMTAAPRLFTSRCGRGARRAASRARARTLIPVIPLSPFCGGFGRDRCEGLRARGGRGEGQYTNAQRSSDGASTLWARFHSRE